MLAHYAYAILFYTEFFYSLNFCIFFLSIFMLIFIHEIFTIVEAEKGRDRRRVLMSTARMVCYRYHRYCAKWLNVCKTEQEPQHAKINRWKNVRLRTIHCICRLSFSHSLCVCDSESHRWQYQYLNTLNATIYVRIYFEHVNLDAVGFNDLSLLPSRHFFSMCDHFSTFRCITSAVWVCLLIIKYS